MTDIQAHDMSRFWRIFTVQHGRVNGTFVVHAGKDGVNNVKPYEVTIYGDDDHRWGRVIGRDDMIAFVRDGAIEIPSHMIRDRVRAEVEDAMGDLVAAIEACVAAFPVQADGVVREDRVLDAEALRDIAKALPVEPDGSMT